MDAALYLAAACLASRPAVDATRCLATSVSANASLIAGKIEKRKLPLSNQLPSSAAALIKGLHEAMEVAQTSLNYIRDLLRSENPSTHDPSLHQYANQQETLKRVGQLQGER